MSLMLIAIVAAFIVLIAAFTLARGWRKLGRVNRLADYWMGLLVLTALCFLPVFLLIWGVDSVIPIPLASEAVSRFDPDLAKFEDKLEDEEAGDIPGKHREYLKMFGLTEDEIRAIQEILWAGWPIIVGVTLLFLLLGTRALAHGHLALLREVEANDNCPPGGADSYVGVQTLAAPQEMEADGLCGEGCEAALRVRKVRGNRSNYEMHQRDGLYERIAVASDDFARVLLFSIAERGPVHVIDRLAADLHEPGHHEIRKSPSGVSSHDDEVCEERGYVLIWNTRRCYVSLACAVERRTPNETLQV